MKLKRITLWVVPIIYPKGIRKMKKSRIILPAIALLAVSGIASVTGTVAWFTANNSVSSTVTNITAINPEGQLRADVTAGVATELDSTGKNITVNKNLRDASVDLASSAGEATVYRAVLDDNQSWSAYVAIDNYRYTADVYYVATWSVTFTIGRSTGTYDFYFDAESSKKATQ